MVIFLFSLLPAMIETVMPARPQWKHRPVRLVAWLVCASRWAFSIASNLKPCGVCAAQSEFRSTVRFNVASRSPLDGLIDRHGGNDAFAQAEFSNHMADQIFVKQTVRAASWMSTMSGFRCSSASTPARQESCRVLPPVTAFSAVIPSVDLENSSSCPFPMTG